VLIAAIACMVNAPATAQTDPKQAAQESANQALSKFGSPEGIRENASNPLTSEGTLMTTIGESTSFSARMSCPSSSNFLTVSISPTLTGDLFPVSIGQDTDLDGTIDATYQPPFPVSGICGNGVISCDSGGWTNCSFYKWDAAPSGRVDLLSVPMTQLGGCYCINNSCGAPLSSNLSVALKDLGGGVVGAVQSINPKHAVTDVRIEGSSITYYGQSSSACSAVPSGGGSTTPEEYYSNPGSLSIDTQAEVMTQSADPESYYSMITNSLAAQRTASDVRVCAIDRAVSITTATSFCQNPPPSGAIASGEETVFLKIYRGSPRTINDCRCSNVSDYCAPPPAAVFATVPEGAVYLGTSAENFRDRGRRDGRDRCTYDSYDYYSLCTRTSDVLIESVTDACIGVDADPKCRLRDESADSVDTYLDYQPTGLTPLPSCRSFTGEVQTHSICRDFWEKQRSYLCETGEGYDFSDIQRRMESIATSVTDNTSSLYYRDLRRDESGNLIGEEQNIRLPTRENLPGCQRACKTKKPYADTEAGISGNTSQFRTTTESDEFFVKTCTSESVCPLDPGEQIVKDCGCLDDFSEAASMMEVLKSAGSDLTCEGAVDPGSGSCLGAVSIFKGEGEACRRSIGGDTTRNCCALEEALLSCNPQEEALQRQRRDGLCHEVGTYCSRCAFGNEPGCSGPGNFCVERSTAFCCFGSKLSRIVQEQGRIQLQSFVPDGLWDLDSGEGVAPNCIGYSPEQLQMIDFSRIDLSEYFGDIRTRSQDLVEEQMGNQIDDFYRNTRP
jgi:hypothetical protein